MRAILQTILGGAIGIFLLLFFMANDDWVVIRLPSLPWHRSPSWPFYEARLFGVMIASFLAGAITFAFLMTLVARRRLKTALAQQQQIEALEKELEKANRLMAAAQKQTGEQQ